MKFFDNQPIRNKLFISHITIMLLTLVLITTSLITLHSSYFDDFMQKSHIDISKLYAERISIILDMGTFSEIDDLDLIKIHEDIDNVKIFDKTDKLVKELNRGNIKWETPKDLIKSETAYFKNDSLYVIEPAMYNNEYKGVIYMKVSKRTHALIENKFVTTILLITAAVILVLIFVVIKLQKKISSPLVKLTERIEEINQNQEYEDKLSLPQGKDEIVTLYSQFNTMLDIISKRENERDQARKSEQFTSEIFSKVNKSAFDAIVVTDNQMKIKYFNLAAEKLSGYKFEEIKETPFYNVFVPYDKREEFKKEIEKFRSTGECAYTTKLLLSTK